VGAPHRGRHYFRIAIPQKRVLFRLRYRKIAVENIPQPAMQAGYGEASDHTLVADAICLGMRYTAAFEFRNPIMAKWLDGVVVENYRWTARLTSLKIEAALGPVQAGQFVGVGLEIDGEIVARPYSLVNPPQESTLEIYFNIVPEGPLSPRLFALEKGDKVLVATNPAGFLTVSEVPETRHLWMMATNTGVGPFLSILGTDEVWQRFDRVILCYSVRTRQELAYSSFIEKLSAAHADKFCFVPIITREDSANSIRARIPASIESGELERAAGVALCAEDSHVMMCGNSEMIKEVSAVLESRGMRRHRRREPGHFTSEKYH